MVFFLQNCTLHFMKIISSPYVGLLCVSYVCLPPPSLPTMASQDFWIRTNPETHGKFFTQISSTFCHSESVSWTLHCFIFLHHKRLRQYKTCSKVNFFLQYARQNFGSRGLHLVNRLYAVIHKTQSPWTKILPCVLNEESYFSATSDNLLLHYAVSLLISWNIDGLTLAWADSLLYWQWASLTSVRQS